VTQSAGQGDLVAIVAELWGRLPALVARLGAFPAWKLAPLALAGLALLLAGARGRRPISVVGGALVGWLGGQAAARALGLTGGLFPLFWAAALGAGSGLLPPLYPFAAGGLVGALIGAWLPVPGQGFVAGGILLLLCGGLALLAPRAIAATTAGLLGAALVGAALAGAGHHIPFLAPLSTHPILLAGVALVLALASSAFQLAAYAPPSGIHRS